MVGTIFSTLVIAIVTILMLLESLEVKILWDLIKRKEIQLERLIDYTLDQDTAVLSKKVLIGLCYITLGTKMLSVEQIIELC